MNLSDIRNLSKDDLLDALGLQTRRTAMDVVLPGLGLFAAGLLVGAGLGLLLAPKSGTELRADLADRIGTAGEKTSGQMAETTPSL
ncbi:MAG: YtxH domain-containing protein [Deltaproteobacteria bacterium]|nr:YtxH domain-containing protein [Deltaproteobacteria bacterium]